MVKTIPRILLRILIPTVETVGSFRFALMIYVCFKSIFDITSALVRVPPTETPFKNANAQYTKNFQPFLNFNLEN
jgi:hypothetical protein